MLGSVVTSRVEDLYLGELTDRGVPGQLAGRLASATSDAVSQGIVPVPPGIPAAVRPAIVAAGQQAFTDALGTALVVAACVVTAGAVIALLVRTERPAPTLDRRLATAGLTLAALATRLESTGDGSPHLRAAARLAGDLGQGLPEAERARIASRAVLRPLALGALTQAVRPGASDDGWEVAPMA